MDQFSRLQMLCGKEKLNKLFGSHVAVFGLGGVGSYAVEALARAGIGKLTIVDNDTVSVTNINRQLYALHSTVGRKKTDVALERIKDINPDCEVIAKDVFFLPETAGEFDFTQYDYVVDCIDTVKAKICLIEKAKEADCPIICSMGTGNKMHPELFEVTDISKTSVCPLARVIRQELKKRGIQKVKVVYSKEEPLAPVTEDCELELKGGAVAPGSNSFVPPAAGLLIASEVINYLL